MAGRTPEKSGEKREKISVTRKRKRENVNYETAQQANTHITLSTLHPTVRKQSPKERTRGSIW